MKPRLNTVYIPSRGESYFYDPERRSFLVGAAGGEPVPVAVLPAHFAPLILGLKACPCLEVDG